MLVKEVIERSCREPIAGSGPFSQQTSNRKTPLKMNKLMWSSEKVMTDTLDSSYVDDVEVEKKDYTFNESGDSDVILSQMHAISGRLSSILTPATSPSK